MDKKVKSMKQRNEFMAEETLIRKQKGEVLKRDSRSTIHTIH